MSSGDGFAAGGGICFVIVIAVGIVVKIIQFLQSILVYIAIFIGIIIFVNFIIHTIEKVRELPPRNIKPKEIVISKVKKLPSKNTKPKPLSISEVETTIFKYPNNVTYPVWNKRS